MNILITGAGKGIGYQTVVEFIRHQNHTIIAVSRNSEHLSRLTEECRLLNSDATVIPLVFDVASGDYTTFFKNVSGKVSHIDILINNSGTLINKPVEQCTGADFDVTFGVNVKGAFLMTIAMLPLLRSASHIVNISSMGGFQGSVKFPGLALYSASKGALAILTECLALEMGSRDIKVNCLALGSVQTEMFTSAFPGYKAPLTAGEMGVFISDFALNGHRYFNGRILPVTISTP
ncbi:MAG: SDR family oxidoreductase [Lentimicrobiaceae bacterium]|jgi:NAD(P)-dependent dehydrogenase (short-subunit alcohol dehydrogenase family)|nr:SDR family oxidoreductase [Lentimicrobiaceae bacterium]